ncbi:Gfo/Idh/MocA family protein [Natronoflexus pectinivorans]|uniref:Secreted protein n=1 Tax=Natronoflexus pectinivorans TaxID=682526 RepID=A0A4R2GHX3_9BACT|nr:Gfo/Idh/MocA family oxidoreductase [Natronoflexus pectinivorans]TCO07771.1 secreted protein [Natronoflexus pectinivorans]
MENSRRNFIKKSALGAAGFTMAGMGMSSSSYARIMGANDRINVAIVGLGRRLYAFNDPISMKSSNVRLAYLCDVMKGQRDRAANSFKHLDYKFKLENDVRKIISDKSVDAVINATPDHWHTPGAIMAVQAGKHVYVEKPGSHNAREGELLAQAYRKYGKVIQLGNQQRSSRESIEIVKQIHNGIIGVPYKAVTFYSNNRGETPIATKAPVPEGLDWELWQGPAPRQEYKHNTWDYHWHWYGWTYGTAETGNNAIHEMDIARWALQVDHPERVSVEADKRHFMNDGWTMYDTMMASFYYPGNKVIEWDGKSRNAYNTYGSDRGTVIFGSEGTVFVNRGGYKLYNRDGKLLRDSESADDEGGTALGGGGGMSTNHVLNFFNTIRGKEELKSPVDEMMKSTHMCHLANLSYRLGKDLTIDPVTGRAKDNDALKLWGREYEPGWEPII